MNLKNRVCRPRTMLGATLLAGAVFSTGAAAQTLTTLYSFAAPPDGAGPLAGLIIDASGNLYGTTQSGGSGCAGGCGTVFKLARNGNGTYSETVLYRFTGAGADGALPYTGSLITDANGNLYGTTAEGGGNICEWHASCGTVFKLTPNNGTYGQTVLWTFAVGTDGAVPFAGLIADAAGNLYGTTQFGGGGIGIVFKLTPNATARTARTCSTASAAPSPTGEILTPA